MASFPATDIALTGLRFARENPKVILTWFCVYLAVSIVCSLIVVQFFGQTITELEALSEEEMSAQLFANFWGVMAPLYLALGTAALALNAIIMAVMNRAVLEPEQSGKAYIRLGGDEVRQALLMLLAIVLCLGFVLIGVVVAGIIGIALASALGGADWLLQLLPLALLLAMLLVMIRFSLASPMTFARRKVTLLASWKLTRGHFWKLLGCYLFSFFVALVVGLAILIIGVVLALVAGGGLATLFEPELTIDYYLSAPNLILQVFSAVSSVLTLPIVMMPPAAIYGHLTSAAALEQAGAEQV